MKKQFWFQRTYIGLIILCLLSLTFVLATLYSHLSYKSQIIQKAKRGAQAESDRMVKEIENRLSNFAAVPGSLLKNFVDGKLSGAQLAKKLEEAASADPLIIRIGIVSTAPDNTALPTNIHYERENGKVRIIQAGESYDVTKEEWYSRMCVKGAGWSEPYFDEGINSYVSVYSMPITSKETRSLQNKPEGVFYFAASLSWLRAEMNSLNPEKKDFGVVLSKKGAILYHPIGDLVLARSNIFDLIKTNKSGGQSYKKISAIMHKAVSGASGEGVNVGRTGESFWYFYRPIPNTEWSLVVNFIKNAVPFDGKILRRQKIQIVLGLAVFLVSLLTIILCFYHVAKFKPKKLWWISILFSLLCVLAAGFTWYLALSVPLNEYQQGRIIIDDQVSLNKFVAVRSKLSKDLYGKESIFIPTGILVQTLEFESSNNISVSGYIWQKFKKGQANDLTAGFVMPEAKSLTLTEAYRFDTDKEQVIGWYFEATLRQSFDYSKYPFDHPNISLWLRPKNFLQDILFVPDLKGYPFISASVLPGLQRRLALPGYTFFGTFFSCEQKMRGVNFGLTADNQETMVPELCYNVLIKRNFITPFVSKLFPILVVISMLFLVMLSFSADTERQKSFGLTGLAVVGLVVSFFFTTLISQADLRQQFGADGIIFIENFNFITYFVLLLSAIQAFLFSAGKKVKFIQFEHCLIPKLLYWPIFTGTVLIVSLNYFY